MSHHVERTGPAAYWGDIAREWGQSGRDLLWRAHSDAVHAAILERWLSPGAVRRMLKTDLFDEAVSAGLVPVLARRAATVVGVDVAWPAARAARARHGTLVTATADVCRLPFGDGAFDVVVSNSTLDHFSSLDALAAALRELWRVLAPDGQLILTLDNLANPLIAARNALPFALAHRTGLVPYYVGATCGPRRLRRMLHRCGFHVVEMDTLVHAPRVAAVPLTRLVRAHGTPAMHTGLLRALGWCERLARWPTRYVTGHFLAVRAVRCALPEERSTGTRAIEELATESLAAADLATAEFPMTGRSPATTSILRVSHATTAREDVAPAGSDSPR